jgi:hypothetical protein
MECASSETLNLLTEPALTRLRASHPCVVLPQIVNRADVVFVHVSIGRELLLKPGLNIIGGVQPRGVNEVIAGDMPDTLAILDVPDIPDMLDMGDGVTAAPFACEEVDVEVIVISLAIVLIIMSDMAVVDLHPIPDILAWELGLSPRPAPAWRMYWGRHCTRPSPFASMLSTQFGNAPVSKYCAYIVSERL